MYRPGTNWGREEMGSRGGNTDHRKIDQTGYKYNQKSLPTERIIDGYRYQAHSRGFQGHTDRQELQAYRYQPSTSLSPRRAPGPASSPNRNDAGIRLGKYLRQSMDPYGQPNGADPFDDGSSSACSAYAKSSVPSSSSDSVHPPSMVCSETSSVSTWENSSSQPSESLTESGNKKPIKVVTSTSKMVEVAPGIRMRLRGAEETWRCVHQDFFEPCLCVGCATTVFCIQDADFVLCPVCQTVSPLETSNTKSSELIGTGGVGLGFQLHDLAAWQEQIEFERKIARKQSQE